MGSGASLLANKLNQVLSVSLRVDVMRLRSGDKLKDEFPVSPEFPVFPVC